MKIINKIVDKVIKVLRYKSSICSISESQSQLAFVDSQRYIYENSGINTLTFSDHWELRKYCLQEMPAIGEVIEFGVYKGKSINFIAKHMIDQNDKRIIYGFDSFKGFSEEWSGVDKNYAKDLFDLKGELPNVEPNIELVNGFIEETLSPFLSQNHIDKVAFVHIDTDTYTPAKVSLELLKPYLKKGAIILFDELCGYPNWRNHEYKALNEVFDQSEYEFLGFAQSHARATLIKAAVRIL